MRESYFQAKLLRALRKHPVLHGAFITKHNDAWTAGLPDISVAPANTLAVFYFELKVYPNIPTKLQFHTAKRLGNRAHFLSVEKDGSFWVDYKEKYDDFEDLVERVVRMCVAPAEHHVAL
jgi:hypothetical protein